MSSFCTHCFALCSIWLIISVTFGTKVWDDSFLADSLSSSISYDMAAPTPCTSARDCSYNGECIKNECQCSPQWMGPHCGVLHLLPTNKDYGYQYVLNGQNVSSWGGPVLRDDDGNYHMWAAEISEYCGINAWQPNSILVHAQSNRANNGIATYERKEQIDGIFSHEPDAIRAPTGEFVIYYSHIYPPPTGKPPSIDPCTDCQNGVTIDCDAQMEMRKPYIINTYMIYATDPNGPWSEPQVIPTYDGIDSNLAGYIYPNGSFIGIFRDATDIVGMFATDWKNNATYKWIKVTLTPGNTGEDPFMWMDTKTGVLHSIWHNGGWGVPIGLHRWSTDGGYNWDCFYNDNSIPAYNNTVTFDNGEVITYQRMERPHLIFDESNIPIALTNGAEQGDPKQQFYPDHTYTLLRPINQN